MALAGFLAGSPAAWLRVEQQQTRLSPWRCCRHAAGCRRRSTSSGLKVKLAAGGLPRRLKRQSRHRVRVGQGYSSVVVAESSKVEVIEEEEQKPAEARPDDGHQQAGSSSVELMWARAALVATPILWGTYSPAVRLTYAAEGAPVPSALAATRSVLLLLAFVPFVLRSRQQHSKRVVVPAMSDNVHERPSLWKAALELALWNTCGTGLQALGLMSSTATRAGFLIQLATVFVPVLVSLGGGEVSLTVWAACLLALGGVAVMGGGGTGLGASDLVSLGSGDMFIVLSAMSYAVYTVRLGVHAVRHPTLELTAAKVAGNAAYSIGWAAVDAGVRINQGSVLQTMWPGASNLMSWLLVLYTAIAPGALAAYLQTSGQSKVPAAQAQVLYALQPIWSAILAAVLLHEESSPRAWAGGSLIVVAALLPAIQLRKR
eukprot:jgi/Chlat1/3449/Chrsp23S03765